MVNMPAPSSWCPFVLSILSIGYPSIVEGGLRPLDPNGSPFSVAGPAAGIAER